MKINKKRKGKKKELVKQIIEEIIISLTKKFIIFKKRYFKEIR